ncbi:MAG TPA: prepilin-type N-terminal cleavage/methylation domain-containing protein [Terriglobia bacterium]|nr:prepilin-type N-terminal cleavage/methylation domain-containing protein [Terriglobia bacterium]
MQRQTRSRSPGRSISETRGLAGFSLLEMLVSVLILTVLMSAVFAFMAQVQKRFQGNAVSSESNQSARAALELMTQEIGQAGLNPNFTQNKVFATPPTMANAVPQPVALNDICQIFPGDWLGVDSGVNFELVQVISTAPPSGSNCAASHTVGGTVTAIFEQDHCQSGSSGCQPVPSPWPPPVASYKESYPSGILQGAGTSDDKTLEFFGDVNGDGVLNYVVYSLYAAAGAPTMTLDGTTYTLYTLYRSITPVTFAAGAQNTPASPLVQNVLYNAAGKQGPTAQPIFAYPVTVTVGVIPNIMTVVGTVVVNLSIAVNPKSMEAGQNTWYTMATQIRPLNLAGAIAANNSGGGRLLPKEPAGLPMSNPANYYQ